MRLIVQVHVLLDFVWVGEVCIYTDSTASVFTEGSDGPLRQPGPFMAEEEADNCFPLFWTTLAAKPAHRVIYTVERASALLNGLHVCGGGMY